MPTPANRAKLLSLSFMFAVAPACAFPMPLAKRSSNLTRGATAGLAIGIAVAVLLLLVVTTLLIVHFRAQSRNRRANQSHSPGLTEKHNSVATTITNENATPRMGDKQTADTIVTQSSQPTAPRRSKSIKDRLMGPLYRDSMIDSMPRPAPAYTRRSQFMGGSSTDGLDKTDSQLDLEYAESRRQGKRETVQSFSSRRVTRLMMMM